jgi:acyl dehydratase
MEIIEGLELPAKTFTVTRADLVRYAGASGDFNVIHWNEPVAKEVGLPDVIAHGMLTMGLAIEVVTDWLDDPSRLLSYGCRFTRPVVVPDDYQGAEVIVSGTVSSVADGVANIALRATCQDVTVLGKATASIKVD